MIEEVERRLVAWDLVHCPPGTSHCFVGAGDRPCMLLAVGARRARGVRYTPTALAPSVPEETTSAADAYAPFGHWRNEGASPF